MLDVGIDVEYVPEHLFFECPIVGFNAVKDFVQLPKTLCLSVFRIEFLNHVEHLARVVDVAAGGRVFCEFALDASLREVPNNEELVYRLLPLQLQLRPIAIEDFGLEVFEDLGADFGGVFAVLDGLEILRGFAVVVAESRSLCGHCSQL